MFASDLFKSRDSSSLPEESAESCSKNAVLQPVISLIVSKASGKYRVHSDSLSAMNIIVSELKRRLILHGKHQKYDIQDPICNEVFPITEYFSIITVHYETREKLVELSSELNNRSQQFRAVQKRLLLRYKDPNPSSLASLDMLLNETYSDIIILSKFRFF